jgi:hypothetical protein
VSIDLVYLDWSVGDGMLMCRPQILLQEVPAKELNRHQTMAEIGIPAETLSFACLAWLKEIERIAISGSGLFIPHALDS